MSILIAAAMLITAPAIPEYRAEAGYDDLAANRTSEAIERIESSADAADGHPASLINLAAAYARQGQVDRARKLLERAARLDSRVDLETANGDWVDSRSLALRAIARLQGQVTVQTRTAMR